MVPRRFAQIPCEELRRLANRLVPALCMSHMRVERFPGDEATSGGSSAGAEAGAPGVDLRGCQVVARAIDVAELVLWLNGSAELTLDNFRPWVGWSILARSKLRANSMQAYHSNGEQRRRTVPIATSVTEPLERHL